MARRNTTKATLLVSSAVLITIAIALEVVLTLWLPIVASAVLSIAIVLAGAGLYLVGIGAFFVEAPAPSGPWVHITSRDAIRNVVGPGDTIHLTAKTPRSGPLFWPPRSRHQRVVFWFAGHPSLDQIRLHFRHDDLDALVAVIVLDPPIDGPVMRRRRDAAITTVGDYVGIGKVTTARSATEQAHGAS